MIEKIEDQRKSFKSWIAKQGGIPLVSEASGVPRTTLYSYTGGKCDGLNGRTLSRIADAFGVSTDILLGMPIPNDTEPADRLRDARIRAGYGTAKSAAEAMGAPVSTYIQHENGSRCFPAETAKRYAKFYRKTPEWLLYGRGVSDPVVIEPRGHVLPLLGQVRAGAWLSVDDSQDELGSMAMALDGRYPHANQWLREVVGDSMDARGISEGDLVHLVDWAEAGIPLATGQIVEVTRHRDAGELREVTLKEVEVQGPGHFLLWPRSTNPRHKDAIALNGADDSGIEVRVTGLLLTSTRRF